MSVFDVKINTEIDLRVYTGHTVCKPAYTVLYFVNGCEVCKNKIAKRITGQATALQNV
jgi:hypothetical protein